jgi:hypothetical protein
MGKISRYAPQEVVKGLRMIDLDGAVSEGESAGRDEHPGVAP